MTYTSRLTSAFQWDSIEISKVRSKLFKLIRRKLRAKLAVLFETIVASS